MSNVPFALRATRLVTCDPTRATATDRLGVIEDGALLVENGRIVALGPHASIAAAIGQDIETIECELVTPGLVDAHTHAAWVGSRHDEYALRMTGADYEAIAKSGGGIVSSMRAVREASRAEIARVLAARLRRMAALGVTTIEVKSGYGLDPSGERKQLEAIASLTGDASLPRVVPTYLALHALPPGEAIDRDAYAERVAKHDLDDLAKDDLFRFVDAYVERSAFTVEQARRVLLRARELGKGTRLHVGQFADVGGAELAAEIGARSADHLEHVSPAGADALARGGVRATLLPVASFTLGQAPPPVALLRSHGVGLVVASDANPGTAPTESLPLAIAFAVRSYGLSIAEAILGVTREAALSLDLEDAGVLREGARADVVTWDLPHESALAQPFGTPRARCVFRDGIRITGS